MDTSLRIGFIGYGEVGGILAGALRERGVEWVGAWDILFDEAVRAAALAVKAQRSGVVRCGSSADLVRAADIVVSAVTASNTLAVAEEAARALRPGTLFLDLNSASPYTKQRCATLVDATGAHYVEAGVMASVPPYGIRVPTVVGGLHARALAEKLAPFGFDMKVVSEKIGVASAIKLCRSVIIKGMESLVIESFATARHFGVEEPVLASLVETFPGIDWERQGSYFFSRVVHHGRRRAEEMREAANMLGESGFVPATATGTALRQQTVADLAAAGVFADLPNDAGWREFADRMLARGEPSKR